MLENLMCMVARAKLSHGVMHVLVLVVLQFLHWSFRGPPAVANSKARGGKLPPL